MEEEECECDEGAPAWMATFSDLATLLLTFFVLLLSFAEMDITEFKTMLGSIREAFGVNTQHPGPFHAAASQPVELSSAASSLRDVMNQDEKNLLRAIRRYIQKEGLTEQVEVLAGQRGVIVRMKDNVLFDTGSAKVKLDGLPILDKIGQLALAFPEGLSVEGHTDDRPINTSQFPSNWELSTARATQTLQALQRKNELPLKRLQVVGYADTKPLVPNDSPENQARNRRVEFVFRRAVPDSKATNPGRPAVMPVSPRIPEIGAEQSEPSEEDGTVQEDGAGEESGAEPDNGEAPETAAINALVDDEAAPAGAVASENETAEEPDTPANDEATDAEATDAEARDVEAEAGSDPLGAGDVTQGVEANAERPAVATP